jgi:hypothetical protein
MVHFKLQPVSCRSSSSSKPLGQKACRAVAAAAAAAAVADGRAGPVEAFAATAAVQEPTAAVAYEALCMNCEICL